MSPGRHAAREAFIESGGRRRRRIVVAVVIGAPLALIIAAAVALHSSYASFNKQKCIGHIKTLSFLLWKYWDDEGEFPDHLGRLLPGYSDPIRFICPSAGRAVPLRLPEGVKTWSPEGRRILDGFGPEHTDYAFVTALNLNVKAKRIFDEQGNHVATVHPPRVETWDPRTRKWLLVFEKEGNHDGERNVSLLDRRVLSLTEAEFKQQLERTLREARAAGLDAKVWGYAPGEGPLEATPRDRTQAPLDIRVAEGRMYERP